MKHIFLLLITLTILSCKRTVESTSEVDNHAELNKEMDKVGEEIRIFEKLVINLYEVSLKKPNNVLFKIDSLSIINENETDKYKSQIKSNIKDELSYLKAEIYYRKGEFEKSLFELNKDDYKHSDIATALAANYVKLKDFNKAKSFIDSIGKGYYIYDYALGNYYESIGDKDEALRVYTEIKKDKEIKHYAYYKLAVERFNELKKDNPKLLNEIYFPTGNPSFEICDSDSENRTKIFKLMEELPENQKWAGTSIIESPQTNDKNYYWVEVKTSQNKINNFYIYENTFEIKFFDKKKNILMSLNDWRKTK
jgi:hypothetical protein